VNRKYSIIIPVYNRPDEIDELLQSLTLQTYPEFEVIIVEDGSQNKCDRVIDNYIHELDIIYCEKENEGQGFARNFGYKKASGDYYIVFDSDCIIPSHYLETVNNYLDHTRLDAFGGPDRAHPSFSPMQKAISYSMTSLFTTGGTRGHKKGIGPFHPRSFNMGIVPDVFEKTGGYILPFKGEDIEFSIRIIKSGFVTGLIPEAYVYHKRRTNWKSFFKQLHFFGMARINISRHYPDQLKPVHFFPLIFNLGLISMIFTFFFLEPLFILSLCLYGLFALILFIDSFILFKNIKIALLSIVAGFIQLAAYGTGFFQEGIIKVFKS
jgi:glycosyltransferase involved in cell wall biosynthesis